MQIPKHDSKEAIAARLRVVLAFACRDCGAAEWNIELQADRVWEAHVPIKMGTVRIEEFANSCIKAQDMGLPAAEDGCYSTAPRPNSE